MTSELAWRAAIISGLLALAIGGYCFIRSDFAVVFPSAGTLILLVLLSLLLLLPAVFVAFLWALPDVRAYTRATRWRAAGRCGHCGQRSAGPGGVTCLECGRSVAGRPLQLGRLACICLGVWLGAGLLGSVAGETLAQIDERTFRQEILGDQLPGRARERWWPFMGELRWNDRRSRFESVSPWS